MKRRIPFVHMGIWILVSIATAVALFDASLRFWYELQSPFTWDSPIYWAVGRGILNGLLPYRDLFETKPPGIFLLSALSFRMFHSPFLGHLLSALSIPLYPLLLGHLTWRMLPPAKTQRIRRIFLTTIASLSGIVLALYTAERSGEFQVESFGALFGLLYLWTIARTEKLSLWSSALAGIFLAGAIGMKEPFLLTLAGGAFILYASEPHRLLRAYIYPLFIAGGTGILLLILLQYFEPYFSIYLPEVLSEEVHTSNPLLHQLVEWWKVRDDLFAYSPAFAAFIGSCFLYILLQPLPKKHRNKLLFCRTLLLCIGAYLGLTAVALKGNFYNHHFAFATPVYVGLCIAWLSSLTHFFKQSIPLRSIGALTVVLLLCTVFLLPHPDYTGRLTPLSAATESMKETARKIDATLDACAMDRYLFLGTNGPQPYGYTTHSPLGPVFFQFHHFLNPALSSFRSSFLRNLSSANFIVRQGGEFNDLAPIVHSYLLEHFTTEPWPCARSTSPVQGFSYQFLYRKP